MTRETQKKKKQPEAEKKRKEEFFHTRAEAAHQSTRGTDTAPKRAARPARSCISLFLDRREGGSKKTSEKVKLHANAGRKSKQLKKI